MPASRRTAVAILLLGGLLAAACGEDRRQPPSGAAPDRPQPASAAVPVDLAATPRPPTDIEELAARVDPRSDGWESEVLSAAAAELVGELAALVATPRQISAARLAPLVGDGLVTGTLRPAALETVLRSGPFEVRRWQPGEPRPRRGGDGATGLAAALGELAAGLGGGERRAETKIVGVETGAARFTTRVHYEASSRGSGSGVAQTATWLASWSTPAPGERPRLERLELIDYEEVRLRAPGGALFADVTASAMAADPSYLRQVVPGIDHWLPRIPRAVGMSLFAHHGLALGDVDGDGLEDLYVCDAGGLPNRLYLQRRDGTVTDVAARAGVDWLEPSASALLLDLDNDGDQDLVVAGPAGIRLAANDGGGRFTELPALDAVASPASMAAADYDLDGDLDLYVCGYDPDPAFEGLPGPVPYHDARNGGANSLLRNEGNLRFVDATRAAGLDQHNDRFSFAAGWEDYDDDGDPDLYVANDFGRNNLYRNDGGRFTDVAAAAGVEDVASGMSVSWADYDRDGRMDLYVGNMYSSAGKRIAYQRRFRAAHAARTAAELQRMARGNTLFANRGDGSFGDVSEPAAVTLGRWAWASSFVDLDDDGWQDLVIANGYVSNDDWSDL